MGWPDSSLREQYDANRRAADGTALGQQTSANEAEIRARQTRQRAVPGQAVGNDLAGRVGASEAETKAKIDKGRTQVSQDAGTLSENYKSSVRHRQDQPQPRRQPSGLGYGGRQRERARTSALRPRSSRSANGTSTKTAFRSQVPSRNRRHHPRNPEPPKTSTARERIEAAQPANGELLVDPRLASADLEATETVSRHAARGVVP